jgi:hypothetical protein
LKSTRQIRQSQEKKRFFEIRRRGTKKGFPDRRGLFILPCLWENEKTVPISVLNAERWH